MTSCSFRISFKSDVVIALFDKRLALREYQPFIHVTANAVNAIFIQQPLQYILNILPSFRTLTPQLVEIMDK